MKLYFFIPLFVLVFFILLIIFIGELRFRWVKKHETHKIIKRIVEMEHETYFSKVINMLNFPNIDKAFGVLQIESSPNCMINSSVVQSRGSWRIAQGKVLFDEDFKSLIDDEYEKKL